MTIPQLMADALLKDNHRTFNLETTALLAVVLVSPLKDSNNPADRARVDGLVQLITRVHTRLRGTHRAGAQGNLSWQMAGQTKALDYISELLEIRHP
jgi:hypothetical protein